MGNWNISIRGVGSHHNKKMQGYDPTKSDADRLTAEFVQKLKDAGHSIASASFTYGAESNLDQPNSYLDARRQVDEG